MAANRKAWFPVALIVLVVGFLVVRTLRSPEGTPPPRQEGRPAPTAQSGTPPTSPDSLKAGRAGSELTSVQRAKLVLKERGYWTGPIDSHYNPELAEALKRFQKDAGMKPTGYLDDRTYAALGVVLHKNRR